MGKSRAHTPVNQVTAERIKQTRNAKRETQESAAEACGYGVTQYRRFEYGKVGADPAVLEKLAAHWNVALQYLTGEENEPLTPLQYATKHNLELKKTAAVNDLWQAVTENDLLRSTVFHFFGYEYEHETSPQIDFAEISDAAAEEIKTISPSGGRHMIKPLGITSAVWVDFSEKEINALLERLKDMIAFEYFRQERRATHDGDNRADL